MVPWSYLANTHRENVTNRGFFVLARWSKLMWSTEKVTLNLYLIPTMNNNSRIQVGGPEKGQCGMRAEASSTHNRHEIPALPSLSSLPLKPKLEQEFSSHHLELDANEVDVSVCGAGNVPLSDEAFDQAVWQPVETLCFYRMWTKHHMACSVSSCDEPSRRWAKDFWQSKQYSMLRLNELWVSNWCFYNKYSDRLGVLVILIPNEVVIFVFNKRFSK